MTTTDDPIAVAAERGGARRRAVAAWIAVGLLVAVFGVAIGAVRATLPDPAATMPTSGAAAAPLDLATVSAPVEAHYRFAAAHADAYAEIPCYCGCDAFLDHRHLADCFVRADGAGWDAHGAGCAICQAEATTARRLLERGDPTAAVRAAVVAQFGPDDDLVNP